ncbi:hypothetical protein RCO27_00065 [Sphingosinicella sp. LHD-64]|uniref:hypothetical protein n=1 Tax=Sphingosinicella sp. LHD-64 TaxID=3072139 RepID=UPI00280C6D12|nr:hypothetical protein [Sphingosinicella sp. LHD-64]MDQ8754614.1 hypothetical protein [Sphingosinicella sp. LHD-64]
MALRLPIIPLAGSALVLGGCVSQGTYPSLAPRPGEREISIAEPVRPSADVPGDAALRQRVAALQAQAAAGQRAFEGAYGAAAAAVNRAGAPESESWIVAQEALSRLEAARGATPEALAALDRLQTDRTDQPTSTDDFALIGAAIAETTRLAEAQEVRIAGLRRRIGG